MTAAVYSPMKDNGYGIELPDGRTILSSATVGDADLRRTIVGSVNLRHDLAGRLPVRERVEGVVVFTGTRRYSPDDMKAAAAAKRARRRARNLSIANRAEVRRGSAA